MVKVIQAADGSNSRHKCCHVRPPRAAMPPMAPPLLLMPPAPAAPVVVGVDTEAVAGVEALGAPLPLLLRAVVVLEENAPLEVAVEVEEGSYGSAF